MLEYILPEFLHLPELLCFSKVNHKSQKTCQLFIFKLIKITYWGRFFENHGCYAYVHYYVTQNRKQLFHIAEMAAFHGNLHCIQQLAKDFKVKAKECEWALNNACLKGKLDIVKFLHEQIGLPLTEKCWIALEYNHLPVVEYLHLKHCKFNGNTIAQTACYGRTKMLIWLYQNRPDDLIQNTRDVSRGIDFCASTSNQNLIELLHSWGFRGIHPIATATNYKQPEGFIDWLRLQGYDK